MTPGASVALFFGLFCVMPIVTGLGTFLLVKRLAYRTPTLMLEKHPVENGVKKVVITLTNISRKHIRLQKEEEDGR